MEYTADEIQRVLCAPGSECLSTQNGVRCCQGITYALCYGYSRCTKSIGCVTPIYYADKIAGPACCPPPMIMRQRPVLTESVLLSERVRMYYHESDDLMSDAGTVCSRASDEELPTVSCPPLLQPHLACGGSRRQRDAVASGVGSSCLHVGSCLTCGGMG
eukprot:911198-Rhodomonas_salina.1